MARTFAAAWVLGVSVAAAACPAPTDYTPQIHVVPGAASRLSVILGEGIHPSRVHVMKEGEELGGSNAIGRPGDLVLENDRIVVVVDRLGSSAGFAECGGNIIDAADAQTRKDELGQVFTYFGTFPRQGVYAALASGSTADGAAWIEASGRELYEPKLRVTTRYTLRPTDRAVVIETTLENTGDTPIELAGVGDAIQWGGAEKIAPEHAPGYPGASIGSYVGGVGRFTSYAVVSLEGDIDASNGNSWTDTVERKAVDVRPREKTTYARLLVVGERADTSSLASARARMLGGKMGDVDVALRYAPGDLPVDVPPDARVSVRDPSGAEVLTIHAAGTPPRIHGELPPGHWVLVYMGGGGRTARESVPVDVVPGAAVQAAFVVSSPAGVRVACVDTADRAMPCKVTFERTDGGLPPDFGPAATSGPARNQVTTSDGSVDVALAYGGYRVTASRGPEYTLAQSDVTLAPGDRKDLRLTPSRVVDTTGYLACDFHQHTMLGTDAPVSTHDRVVANAAEGVEVAVASEHNYVVSFESIVQELHLERDLASVAGDELTSDASRHPWGHANVWPLPVDATKPRGGAPVVRDRLPGSIFDELRRSAGSDIVVQINHPRSGRNGYFDQTGFDRDAGAGTDPAYDAHFDAVEVWNGRNVEARGRVLDDFLALLRTGHVVTPTADTDTHGVVGQEAGYPRTYVRVDDDGPLDGWDAARIQDVVRGVKARRDVVLTNGPMLRVSANGVPVGGMARGRSVEVRIHIESAPWVVVDEVHVVRALGADGPQDEAVVAERPKGGALAADVVFTIRAQTDDAFVVVASGSRPMSPVLAASSTREIEPWAMTGAIWIDADGDGRSLGR